MYDYGIRGNEGIVFDPMVNAYCRPMWAQCINHIARHLIAVSEASV